MTDDYIEIPTASEMADRIVRCVTDRAPQLVTLGNLIVELGGNLVRGESNLKHETLNILIFVGCSDLFAEATTILLKDRPPRVVLRQCEPLILIVDGCPFPTSVPFAKTWRKYVKERFMPCGFVAYSSLNEREQHHVLHGRNHHRGGQQ